jgi:hypothetical protein
MRRNLLLIERIVLRQSDRQRGARATKISDISRIEQNKGA